MVGESSYPSISETLAFTPVKMSFIIPEVILCRMAWVWTALKYSIIGFGVLTGLVIVLSLLVGLVGAIFGLSIALFSLFFSIVLPGVSLIVLGAIAYAVYKLISESENAEQTTDTVQPDTTQSDSVARLKQQYAEGKLSEDEFERRLEIELDDTHSDPIERELQYERE